MAEGDPGVVITAARVAEAFELAGEVMADPLNGDGAVLPIPGARRSAGGRRHLSGAAPRPAIRKAGPVLPVILVVLVVLLVVVAVAVRRGAGAANARIESTVAELDVERRAKANFYGIASKGAGQARGLGTLVLTPDALVFLQVVPATELRVPRASVTHVEVAGSFLGKAQNRDLLVLSWRVGNGDEPAEERAAFDVPDVEGWRLALVAGP